jgi:hypothetical protein
MMGGGGKEWVDEIFPIVCIGVSLDVVPKKFWMLNFQVYNPY